MGFTNPESVSVQFPPNGESPGGPEAWIATSGQREPTPSYTCWKQILLRLSLDHLLRHQPASESHRAIGLWAEAPRFLRPKAHSSLKL